MKKPGDIIRITDSITLRCSECGKSIDPDTVWVDEMSGYLNIAELGVVCDECDAKRKESERIKKSDDKSLRAFYRASGIPMRCQNIPDKNFSSEQRAKISQIIGTMRDAGAHKRSFIFSGPPDSGKTYTACYVLQKMFLNTDLDARRFQYDSLYNLSLAVRGSWQNNGNDDGEVKFVTDFSTRKTMLVLETLDIDVQSRATDLQRRLFLALADHRNNHNLPTIFISCLDSGRLKAIYGDAIVSRVIQMADVVKFERRGDRTKNVKTMRF